MDQVRFVVLYVAFGAAMLLVVAGPVYGFDVPRLSVIAVSGVVLVALSGPALRHELAEVELVARITLAVAVIFAVWVLLVTVLGDVPRLSLHGQQGRFVGAVALTAPVALVIALPTMVRTQRDVGRLLGVLAGLLAVASGYGLIQYLGLDPMPWRVDFRGRPVSFYGNPNFVGAVLCLATPVAWWVWTRGSRWRVPAAALVLASGFAMYASRVRLGGIAAVAGAVVVALAMANLPWKRLQAGLLAAVPIGGVVFGLFATAVGALLGDKNGIARVSFWRTSVRMWVDSPLVGQGIGRFEPAYRRLRAPAEVTAGGVVASDLPVDSSHAFVVDLAATGGAPAALLWLVVLVLAGLLLARTWTSAETPTQRIQAATLAGLLGAHGVQSSISVPIVTTVWLGWFLVGLTLAAAALPESQTKHRRARTRRGSSKRRRSMWTKQEKTAFGVAVVLGLGVAVPALQFFLSTSDVGTSRVAQRAGQFDLALSTASRAAQRSAGWPQAWHETSRSASALGDVGTARDAATRAIEIDESDRVGMLLLREIDRETLGDDAVHEWNLRLLEFDPNGFAANFDLLLSSRIVGDDTHVDQAIETLEQTIGPDHPRWDDFVVLRDSWS